MHFKKMYMLFPSSLVKRNKINTFHTRTCNKYNMECQGNKYGPSNMPVNVDLHTIHMPVCRKSSPQSSYYTRFTNASSMETDEHTHT